jgi:hypothetical protein
MNRFETTFGWRWLTIVIFSLALGLSGCEGSDGAAGLDGQDGAAGPPGAEGPPGPPGPGASITPLESCGVCHSEGSFASAPAAHEVFDIASFADFVVAPGGPLGEDLVVSFSVTVNSAAATGARDRSGSRKPLRQ